MKARRGTTTRAATEMNFFYYSKNEIEEYRAVVTEDTQYGIKNYKQFRYFTVIISNTNEGNGTSG